ncbi:MAG: D-Ala-D-Ala carboxypeptidase family metallohydrolase [Burkholderiaceae bacterium]
MSADWVYFTVDEMKCKGTDECEMDQRFMERLIDLREDYGKPMPITSGYRSLAHNSAVGGSPNSAHIYGRAVDVAVTGNNAYDLIQLAMKHGFTGIGVAQRGAHNKRFIHIDDMDDSDKSPRPTVWSYK